ncbi:MAG: hypothetical protein U0174_26725 [Polyangiaceae bacterium]
MDERAVEFMNKPVKLWAKLKDCVRRTVNDTREAFDAAVACALDTISNAGDHFASDKKNNVTR